MSKVIVGMSGGVDSAVTAYLMKLAGYDVVGVTLKSWVSKDGKNSRCCEIDTAKIVSEYLDIPYYVHNCITEFKNKVTDPFIDDYFNGRTPNPCVLCNRHIKWELMLNMADSLGADYVATGHYASVVTLDNKRKSVKTSVNAKKDQTYMLYKLSQEALSRTIMPLGRLTKEEVRDIARKAGIPVAEKPDSQELCFVPDGNYTDYLLDYSEREVKAGNFVTEEGAVLGPHKGIIYYTVGQRKGLGLSLGAPGYVKHINPQNGDVVIAPAEGVMSHEIICEDLNYLSIEGLSEGKKIEGITRVRYHHAGESSVIEGLKDGLIKISFDNPVKAPAPGQAAVFYDKDGIVIGGGTIKSVKYR